MDYQNIRSKIKTGDLVFFSNRGWKTWSDIESQIVRFFTRSNFSHVGMAYVQSGRVLILEAVGTGVRLHPLSDRLPGHLAVNPKQLDKHAEYWAFAQIGKPYESKLRMVWDYIFNKNVSSEKERFQCGEYVNQILKENGQQVAKDDSPSALFDLAAFHWPTNLYLIENLDD